MIHLIEFTCQEFIQLGVPLVMIAYAIAYIDTAYRIWPTGFDGFGSATNLLWSRPEILRSRRCALVNPRNGNNGRSRVVVACCLLDYNCLAARIIAATDRYRGTRSDKLVSTTLRTSLAQMRSRHG